MRSDYPRTGTTSTVAKASTSRRGTISKKEQIESHQSAFGSLLDDVSKKTGLPGDEVVYHDPMGFTTNGEPVDLRKGMYEDVWADAFAAFNDQIRKGANVYDAAETVCKAIGRANFSLPIFVSPDVTITDERQTPFADMVTRVAIQEDTYKVDEQIDHGESSRFSEPGSGGPGGETWAEEDDTYDTHSYEIVPYGRQTSVTDFLQLSAQTLRSSQAITEEALIRSQRFYEENQAFNGNGTATPLDGYDPNGYAGLPDLVRDEASQLVDRAGDGPAQTSWVRRNIESLRRDGAQYDDIVSFTDHTTFGSLKDDVDDILRYESPGDELSFGFQALNIDGTPVVETHGISTEDGDRAIVSLDMSEVAMPMLQDATLHPLARTAPEEDVAVDSYGTLASSSTTRIQIDHGIGGAGA